MVASTPVIMRGNTHDIPIILHTCVSEIISRGKWLRYPTKYDNKLFRLVGLHDSSIFSEVTDQRTILQVAAIFNRGPFFGDGCKVHKNKPSTLSAVLIYFLDNIKGFPVIHPMILDGIKKWCASWTAQKHEKIACKIAANLLKFLPIANLSLLTYMLDFFLRLLDFPENTFRPSTIASIFGHPLIGRPMNSEDHGAIVWLMTRWPSIVRELYGDGSGHDAWGSSEGTGAKKNVMNNPSLPAHQIRWLAEQRQRAQAVAYQHQVPRRPQQQQHPQRRLAQQPPPRRSSPPCTNSPRRDLIPEQRTGKGLLEVPAGARCRTTSFASSRSAYSNGELLFCKKTLYLEAKRIYFR